MFPLGGGGQGPGGIVHLNVNLKNTTVVIHLKGELGQLDTAGARSISVFGSRNVISGRCTTPDGLRDIKHRKNDPTDAVGSLGYPVDRPILPISISDF